MTSLRRGYLFAALGMFLVIAGHGLQAQPPERVRVIIGFQQQPGPNEQALVRGFGGRIGHTFSLVPAIAAELPAAAVNALRNNPNVTNVDEDVQVQESDAELDNSWGVKHIGSGVVHNAGNKGSGVVVCVIDSGVDYTHPDMGNYIGGWDYVNDDSFPFDDRGHGSHVAGTILALDNDLDTTVVGVAPEASVRAYKILDQNGNGFISHAMEALEDCVAKGSHVSNNSFGTQSNPGSSVEAAYAAAEAAGLVNVAAAGNALFGPCKKIAYPARYSSVIAVTATDPNNQFASFSCRGSQAELAAPGVAVNSTVPTGTCTLCDSSGYLLLSGTSMASPHVAGVAALIIASGITDNNEVRQRLQQTADNLGSPNKYGYGLVDAAEAAGDPPTPPAAPSGLLATAVSSSQIDLVWTDNSNNESGFEIERCAGSCDTFTINQENATNHSDTGLAASTEHTYRVRAYNSADSSQYSLPAVATTLDPPPDPPPGDITLDSVDGYKVKGKHQADLSWSGGAPGDVDIFRDGGSIATTDNDGAYTDIIGNRGSASYIYTVCQGGSCSDPVTISF